MAKVQANDNWALDAIKLVYGDREADYDHPIRDFVGTALNITSLLRRKLAVGEVIGVLDVPMIMIGGFKPSRESHKHKDDNIIDTIGYALTMQRVQDWLDSHDCEHTDLFRIVKIIQEEIAQEKINAKFDNMEV